MTHTTDGAGLACGVFSYLLSLGINRPKVLGATHYHELFENNFLKPTAHLTLSHMDIHLDQEAHEPEDQVTYLYRSGHQCRNTDSS